MIKEALLIDEINRLEPCDVVAIKCKITGITVSSFSNGILQKDDSAILYLQELHEFDFLLKKKAFLFYTKKTDSETTLSYEYKLRQYSAFSSTTKRLAYAWIDCPAYSLIRYFAKTHRQKQLKQSGIYFWGIEYPNGRPVDFTKAILKIYFRAHWEDINGLVFNSHYFNEYVANCMQSEFCKLAEIASDVISANAEYYLIAWNWDKISNNCCYKLYFVITEHTNISQLVAILSREAYGISDQVKFATSDVVLSKLKIRGFAIGIDTMSTIRINFYYKQQ